MLSGNAVGLMSQESFVDELNPQDQKQSKETVLYFANKQGNRLKKITTDITYNAVEAYCEAFSGAVDCRSVIHTEH